MKNVAEINLMMQEVQTQLADRSREIDRELAQNLLAALVENFVWAMNLVSLMHSETGLAVHSWRGVHEEEV